MGKTRIVNEEDIIDLKFYFKIKRKDVRDLVDHLVKTNVFMKDLDKGDEHDLRLIKMMSYIPTGFVMARTVYSYAHRNFYPFKYKRFMKEIYILEVYGFVKSFKDEEGYWIKNISNNKFIIEAK